MFLCYDIAAQPYATAAVLRFDAAVAPYYGKSAILGGCCKPGEQLHYLFFPCSPVGSLSCCLFLRYDIVAHPCGAGGSATFRRYSCPVLWKSAILGARCKPWEQLRYLFLPCSPVGSPSWCLFLLSDIDAHPYATTTVLRLTAASPPYCGKALFWAHTASRTNK